MTEAGKSLLQQFTQLKGLSVPFFSTQRGPLNFIWNDAVQLQFTLILPEWKLICVKLSPPSGNREMVMATAPWKFFQVFLLAAVLPFFQVFLWAVVLSLVLWNTQKQDWWILIENKLIKVAVVPHQLNFFWLLFLCCVIAC